jgi:hypothetical protein
VTALIRISSFRFITQITYLIVVQFQAGQNPYEEKCTHCDQFPWRIARVDDRHPFQKRSEKCFIRYKVKYISRKTTSSHHHCEGKNEKGQLQEGGEHFSLFRQAPSARGIKNVLTLSILPHYEPCLSSRSIDIKPNWAKLSCVGGSLSRPALTSLVALVA